MYNWVEWGSLKAGEFTQTVEPEFNWETRRIKYKIGGEPNFQNPPTGHLPITIGIVRGVAFPQFAEVCQF